MIRSRSCWRSSWLLSLLTVAVAMEVSGRAADVQARAGHNCGARSLSDLSRCLGRPAQAQDTPTVSVAQAEASATMAGIRDAGTALDIELTGVAGTIDQLSAVAGPKILHLDSPAHFLVLVRADTEWAQVMDGGRLMVVPRPELEQRYSGHALICAMPSDAGAPKLELGSFHHSFGVAGVGQKIEHAFTVRNSGQQPLTLEQRDDGG